MVSAGEEAQQPLEALAGRPAQFYQAMEVGQRVLFQGGTATQSRDPWGGSADRAIDANTDGNWSHNPFTHTYDNDHEWWEWDLGALQSIGRVHLWFRTDGCTERNDNHRPTIYDRANPVTHRAVWAQNVGTNPGSNKAFEIPNHLGQVIRVEHPSDISELLSLPEVQVEVWP